MKYYKRYHQRAPDKINKKEGKESLDWVYNEPPVEG